MNKFTYEIREQKELTKRSEQWSAEINGYYVIVTRSDDGLTEIGIAPTSYDRIHLPLLKFYPKNVNDIENLAVSLPNLLQAIILEMRNAGLDDLRSKWDIKL